MKKYMLLFLLTFLTACGGVEEDRPGPLPPAKPVSTSQQANDPCPPHILCMVSPQTAQPPPPSVCPTGAVCQTFRTGGIIQTPDDDVAYRYWLFGKLISSSQGTQAVCPDAGRYFVVGSRKVSTLGVPDELFVTDSHCTDGNILFPDPVPSAGDSIYTGNIISSSSVGDRVYYFHGRLTFLDDNFGGPDRLIVSPSVIPTNISARPCGTIAPCWASINNGRDLVIYTALAASEQAAGRDPNSQVIRVTNGIANRVLQNNLEWQ